jgi:hypothetical protein
MDPITLGLVTGIPAAVKSGTGILQFLEGRRKARAERPMREIPEEVQQNLTQAKTQALEGMPEATRNMYLQQMQRQEQNALRQLGDRKAGIAGVPYVYQQQQDALNQLASTDANMRLNNLQNLQANRAEMGRQRDMNFQLNEFEPFLNQMRMAEGLIGAGMQNVMGGLTDSSKMLLDYDMYDRYMGGKGVNFNLPNNNTNKTSGSNTNFTFTNPYINQSNNINTSQQGGLPDMLEAQDDYSSLGGIVPPFSGGFNWLNNG